MNSCKDCQERHLYCHDTCEKYKKDCEERAELKKKKLEATQYDIYIHRKVAQQQAIKRIWRENKRR